MVCLAQAHMPVCMLTVQYRMHSAISSWPSKHFYEGLLVNADSVKDKGRAAAFHRQSCFSPLMLYDCRWFAYTALIPEESFHQLWILHASSVMLNGAVHDWLVNAENVMTRAEQCCMTAVTCLCCIAYS